MKLAIVLVHNKNNTQNAAQVEDLKSLVAKVGDQHQLIGLAIPHELRIYQVVPYGVTPPVNRYEINSGGIVYYGDGDEDKTGNHAQFFNWGLKRSTDYGAEVCVYLKSVPNFDVEELADLLPALVDPANQLDSSENSAMKIGTIKSLKKGSNGGGQLLGLKKGNGNV